MTYDADALAGYAELRAVEGAGGFLAEHPDKKKASGVRGTHRLPQSRRG